MVTEVMHHPLQCMSGFYRTRDEATQTASRLRTVHALPADQVTLLAPPGVRPGAVFWHAWQRAYRMTSASGIRTFSAAWAAVAGGLAGAITLLFWQLIDGPLSRPQTVDWYWVLVGLGLATAAGAAVGFIATVLRGQLRQPQRFSSDVRSRLAAGHWAVVVHSVPAPHQAAVVSLLQSASVAWSAAAHPMQRL